MIQTKQDWCAWVDYVQPPDPKVPSAAAFSQMSDRERLLINRVRQGRNSELVTVRTTAMDVIAKRIRSTIRVNENAPPTARRGVVIDGDPTVGKTTLVTAFGKEFELEQRKLYPERFATPIEVDGLLVDYCPVVYITTPAKATPKMLACTIAEYLGVLYRQRDNTDDITRKILRAMKLCGTQLLIVDDIHFLDLSHKDGRLVNDYLKQLANQCAATFVYAGADIGKSSLFNEGAGAIRDTQTSGRFTTYRLERLTLDTKDEATEWAAIIKAMEASLMLYRHRVGSLASQQWRYLHERSRGSISTLAFLIRMAADDAIETGVEEITRDVLDGIRTDESAQRAYERQTRAASRSASRRPRKAAAS